MLKKVLWWSNEHVYWQHLRGFGLSWKSGWFWCCNAIGYPLPKNHPFILNLFWKSCKSTSVCTTEGTTTTEPAQLFFHGKVELIASFVEKRSSKCCWLLKVKICIKSCTRIRRKELTFFHWTCLAFFCMILLYSCRLQFMNFYDFSNIITKTSCSLLSH